MHQPFCKISSRGEGDGRVAATLLQDFIRTPSVSPDYAPGAPRNTFNVITGVDGLDEDTFGEGRMAKTVASHFEALGAEVHWDVTTPGRPAVYGVFRAAGPAAQRWLGLDVHLDTVGVQTAVDPFAGLIDADGRIHGRGSCDTKASLAAALDVLYHAQASGQSLPHNLVIAGTIDEETSPLGARQWRRWLVDTDIVIDELMVRQLRHHFGPFRAHFSAPPHPARAVCYTLLGTRAGRVLIGAWNPMV